MTEFNTMATIAVVGCVIVFCYSWICGTIGTSYVSMFIAVAVFVGVFFYRDIYIEKYGESTTYESAVVDKRIEYGYSRAGKREFYVLSCMNPYEPIGSAVDFYVNSRVYNNTSIGDRAVIVVEVVGDTVVRAQLMGNNGIVGEVE